MLEPKVLKVSLRGHKVFKMGPYTKDGKGQFEVKGGRIHFLKQNIKNTYHSILNSSHDSYLKQTDNIMLIQNIRYVAISIEIMEYGDLVIKFLSSQLYIPGT